MTKNIKRLGFFSRILDNVSAEERYSLAEKQILHAEHLGFHTAWVAQHHFHPDEGGLPSPFVFLSYLAAKTRQIRLGTGVITLSMENPIRVAEDAAVFDLLANGRIELGFGTGGTRESFEAFGVDPDKRGDIYGHNLTILRKALAGKDLHAGSYLYPGASHLLDHFWMATFSPLGGKLAGESEDGLMLSRTQPRPKGMEDAPLDDIQNPIIDAYLDALPDNVQPRIMASRSLFVSSDRAYARAMAEKGLKKAAKRFEKVGQYTKTEKLDDLIAAFDQHVGTPEDVIQSLKKDTALERATDIVFQVHSVDPPHDDIMKSIELTAKEVAPSLGIKLAI
ncbi:putative FMN-dependent luciferase-like monooxygenase [Bartonella tamiae]|uniref:Luciferase-like domain-containing protein n=1 Tax=Bartonella tamiae Th239 TaxID=1094558 RepID=J0ZPT1_9HYPH|nr:putative FMN-dependent luciferase-like monooxygenase [Bartonella tamiae]EJF90608.1 hypothetical protein ME5_01009 [Bartonella tamiae Th239]EJF94014.1 hypothetical protein MEG_00872 [Bartonella tamiae Th307]